MNQDFFVTDVALQKGSFVNLASLVMLYYTCRLTSMVGTMLSFYRQQLKLNRIKPTGIQVIMCF